MDLKPIARDIVMDHIPELVLVLDAHDRILDANRTMEKWLGRSKEEIIGHDPLDVFRHWPQMLNRMLFSSEETRQEIEVPGEPPTMLELVVMPIFDKESGQLSGRVIVGHDITQRKQLENNLSQLTQKLHGQAIRDQLTGVFNRRFLAEALEHQIAKASEKNTSLSIIMMDVDHFKKFNDTYGHKCGDFVLKDLSNFLMENSRQGEQGDIVCRYGGEEFVILMPNASETVAFERAEAWRQEYSAKILHFEGRELRTTFSAGVATYSINDPEGEKMLHAVDLALYQSKNNGRNQVTLYKPMESTNAD
jgi:two-component system, cell cycle response regulator